MGLSNVAGYFSKLKAGFDEIEVKSYLLDISPDVFSYTNTYKVNVYLNFVKYLYMLRTKSKNIVFKIFFLMIYKLFLLPIFVWALFKFDVFIFGFNHSFYRLFDLPILKFFGKKVILVYLGSDARPPYMNGIELIIEKRSVSQIARRTKKVKNKIRFAEKYADYVISSPTIGQFHEKNFIDWMCIGMPTILQQEDENIKSVSHKVTRIVHAPSRPITKGSAIFTKIIEKLKLKYEIEYIELVGKTNDEVLNELQQCDFVLDEIYSDMPLGGLSSEAASFKKITVVGGYYFELIKSDVQNKYIPPSLYCHPDQIEELISRLINDKRLRESLGKDIFNFIKMNWSSREIASKYLMLIDNIYPEEWVYNTNSNEYIYGYGISKEELKKQYINMYDKFGIEVFQLKHNPNLEKKIFDFIHA